MPGQGRQPKMLGPNDQLLVSGLLDVSHRLSVPTVRHNSLLLDTGASAGLS